MGDGRFTCTSNASFLIHIIYQMVFEIQTLGAENFHMQVGQSSGYGQGHTDHGRAVNSGPVQKVK